MVVQGTNIGTLTGEEGRFGRRNVAQYYWDAAEGRVAPMYQWGRLPVFGLEYEF